jgi:methyl acetate hydrolase
LNTSEYTIFAIASMTKPVTSVAVLQLIEAGNMRLDEPAATCLKEVADVGVLEAGKLRRPKSPVAVRQLLVHTSGFAYEFIHKDISEYASKGNAPSMAADGARFLKAPLVADPRVRWEYGISHGLARIARRGSHRAIVRPYFERHIFEPLQMKYSFFVVPPAKQARVASVYQRKPDGGLEKLGASPFKPSGFLSGGGGLYSTAADYLQFSRALLAGGELGGRRILKQETIATMATNQIGDLALAPFRSLTSQGRCP